MKTRTRTARPRKAAARPPTPAQAIQRLRTSTRKAVEAGVEAAAGVRRTAIGAFDSLVKQGAALEAKSRRVAIARATEARDAAVGARTRTVEAVSQLEKVFERRVSKAMSKLGVPTTRDVRALSRQVAQLQESVERLRRARARAR